ncbi:MAG: MarR family transcriptional regulator [Clostridiales bacterium]|nr:MarR family transcriptional regulator [Clostridiales bacterium]
MDKKRETGKYDALKLERQLCFPLYAASRKVIGLYHPYLSALDLTYTQYITLMVLWQEGSESVKELGRRLYLDSGTLTPLLKSMEKKGLIVKKRSEKDERSVIVAPSESGMALRERALGIPEKVGNCLGIDGEEALALRSLLYGIIGAEQEK